MKYLRKAAENLSELVNDLLDLAKVEAGKTEVRPGGVRGRRICTARCAACCGRCSSISRSSLDFDEPAGLPTMRTDEGKVSQILRNFISNALKYTERGHVRVSRASGRGSAKPSSSPSRTPASASRREDQQRIFDEFAQVEHPLQRKFKGTGLGLPLSKRLAELLGGRLWVESEPGVGSTFFAEIPIRLSRPGSDAATSRVIASWALDPARAARSRRRGRASKISCSTRRS